MVQLLGQFWVILEILLVQNDVVGPREPSNRRSAIARIVLGDQGSDPVDVIGEKRHEFFRPGDWFLCPRVVDDHQGCHCQADRGRDQVSAAARFEAHVITPGCGREVRPSEPPLNEQASEDAGCIAGHGVDGISIVVRGLQLTVGDESEVPAQAPALQEFPAHAHPDRDSTIS